jgi:hypothetical protein
MELSSQIRSITQSVRNQLVDADLSTIFLEGERSSITTVCHKILNRVEAYDQVEKSVERRIEVLDGLSAALRELAVRVDGEKGRFYYLFNETQLSRLWGAVDYYRDRQTPFLLVRIVQAVWDQIMTWMTELVLWLYSSGDEYKFKECAFRTVKNLGIIEGMILDPKVQGAPPILLFRSVKNDIEEFIRDEGPLALSDLYAQLEFAEQIAFDQLRIKEDSLLDSSETKERKIADLAYRIEAKIERLRVGESLLLPGGYLSNKTGHAVAYEVKRMDELNYQFALYNTGDGAHHGLDLWGLAKMLWYWAVEPIAFRNLSKHAVTDQAFLTNLLRWMIDSESKADPMGLIFRNIKAHCVDLHGGQELRLNRHELQSWGTCAYDSIRSYLKAKLDADLFARFEAHVTQRSYYRLIELLPQIRNSGAFNAHSLALIETKARDAFNASRQVLPQLRGVA